MTLVQDLEPLAATVIVLEEYKGLLLWKRHFRVIKESQQLPSTVGA